MIYGSWVWAAILLFFLIFPGCSSYKNSEAGIETAVSLEFAPEPTRAPPTMNAMSATAVADPFFTARQKMVEDGIIAWGITNPSVIEAMRRVPRHEFVIEMYIDQSYANHPLPIGFGQTISQPYIVALMSEAAELEPDDAVLEIGTGSGYQAAVLAEIVDQVFTMEIIDDLADRAAADLAALGYDNIEVRNADGYFGWEEKAPFDAIVVTAAPDHVPQPLAQQLKIGGHMIIPVGPIGGVQTLWRITRSGEDEYSTENLGDVRFVPLTGQDH